MPAAIPRGFQQSPPMGGIWADFVEQEERAVRRLEEDGVVASVSVSIGNFGRLGPHAIRATSRKVDADIRFAFRSSSEPRGSEVAPTRLNNRRGMAGRE